MKKISLVFILTLTIFVTAWATLSLATLQVASQPFASYDSATFFFPPYHSASDRLGYGRASANNSTALNAGWYLDWAANTNPTRWAGEEYARLIGFHSDMPFCQFPTQHGQVTPTLTGTQLLDAVAKNPGALWIVGNEPDSLYNGDPVHPKLYAELYHYFYTSIKQADPRAQVSPAAIVQPSPLRMAFLDQVLSHYQQTYSQTLPADLWNIHFYILNEGGCGSWGAAIPPVSAQGQGWQIAFNAPNLLNLTMMEANLKAFRQWMKDRGYQNIPLIITEYGVLPPATFAGFEEDVAAQFLSDSNNLFMNATDPDIGYPADGNRLVQMWAWFATYASQYGGDLFQSTTGANLTLVGSAFATQTMTYFEPYVDLEVVPPEVPMPLADNMVVADVFMVNRGNTTATNIQAQVQLLDYFSGSTIATENITVGDMGRRYAQLPTPIRYTWPLAPPYAYTLTVTADPGQISGDVNSINNVFTEPLVRYPDPTLSGFETMSIDFDNENDLLVSTVALTVTNTGAWTATTFPVMIEVQDEDRSTILFSGIVTVPLLTPNQTFTTTFDWMVSDSGIYQVSATLQTNAILDWTKANNYTAQSVVLLKEPTLQVSHNYAPLPAQLEESLTYTLLITNVGLAVATDTTILANFSTGWALNGPIQLTPAQGTAIVSQVDTDLPVIASQVTLEAQDSLMIMVPLTVTTQGMANQYVTHTITISSPSLAANTESSTTIYVTPIPQNTYFPLVFVR